MHELTSLEIGVIVHELKPLEGSRLRKFYDLGSGTFKIAFYKNPDVKLAYIKLLKTINLTAFSEAAGEATQFAMSLRKRIENSVVDTIEQINNDRILRFMLDKGKYSLVVEMYGKGNMLLLNRDNTIEVLYKQIIQKDRELKKGTVYAYPKAESQDIFSMTAEQANSIAENIRIDKTLIKELSKALNIGPLYLEDIITRAGIDPNASELAVKQREELGKQILELSKRLAAEKPRIYLDKGAVIDYAACSILKYKGLESKEFESMSLLLDELHLTERTSMPDTARQQRLKELTLNIEKQEQLEKQLAIDSEEYAMKGKIIMANMAKINELCYWLRENRRATLNEVKERFPELGIKELDLKNKTITLSGL